MLNLAPMGQARGSRHPRVEPGDRLFSLPGLDPGIAGRRDAARCGSARHRQAGPPKEPHPRVKLGVGPAICELVSSVFKEMRRHFRFSLRARPARPSAGSQSASAGVQLRRPVRGVVGALLAGAVADWVRGQAVGFGQEWPRFLRYRMTIEHASRVVKKLSKPSFIGAGPARPEWFGKRSGSCRPRESGGPAPLQPVSKSSVRRLARVSRGWIEPLDHFQPEPVGSEAAQCGHSLIRGGGYDSRAYRGLR